MRGLAAQFADPPLTDAWPWPVRVYTLGRFEIECDGKPVRFSRKVQRRPLDVLRVLIALGGQDVREGAILDLVWPVTDGDRAALALTAALHRLRTLVGRKDAVIRHDGRVGLNRHVVWVDAWAAERLLDRAETTLAHRQTDSERVKAVTALTDRVLAWHRGPFLPTESDQHWAVSLSRRLVDRLTRQLVSEGDLYAERTRWTDAAERYERAFALEPHADRVARALMQAYHHLGHPSQVDRVFYEFRDTLRTRLGASPPSDVDGLWRTLRAVQ